MARISKWLRSGLREVLSDLSVKQPSDVLRDLTEVVAELPTKPLDAVARDLVRALDPQIRRNVRRTAAGISRQQLSWIWTALIWTAGHDLESTMRMQY